MYLHTCSEPKTAVDQIVSHCHSFKGEVVQFWIGSVFGDTYFIKIRAIDDSDHWSEWSNVVVASFANESLFDSPVNTLST